MKIKGFVLLIVLLACNNVTWSHYLKLSFSRLNVSSEGIVDLETHIFLDDITSLIKELYDLPKADFTTNSSNGTVALQNYLQDHLYFKQFGRQLPLRILSIKLAKNGLAIVIKLSTSDPLNSISDLYLFNTLLCDAYPMQTNYVNYQDEEFALSINNPKLKIQIK